MWVKICGIRDVETAREIVAAGVDAIGLNFYQPSPRSVPIDDATAIANLLPDPVIPVGLFVNDTPETVADICRRCGIEHAQLHGDETPEMLAELQQLNPDLKIIRAFRVGSSGLKPVAQELKDIRKLDVELFACLIDARVENVYGGSGKTAPWEMVAEDYQFDEWPKLILAGGLTPDNVAEAIRVVKPWGVDTAGGVESAPGVKNKELSQKFVQIARQAP